MWDNVLKLEEFSGCTVSCYAEEGTILNNKMGYQSLSFSTFGKTVPYEAKGFFLRMHYMTLSSDLCPNWPWL